MGEAVVASGRRPGLGRDTWRVAVVVILGAIMSVLDTTIVNVALDSLSRDLHATLDGVQWVVTAYLLSLGAVIPVSGWAARRFGAKRVFLVSVVLFTAGSALCGLSGSLGELIVFRALQGIGGGLILPVGQIILVKKAGPANIARAMSAIGVPVVLAPVVGPTLGGLLLDDIGWRFIFFVNVPVGILAVIAAVRLLPRDDADDPGPLDLPGLALVAPGMVGITYALAEIGTASLGSLRVLGPLVAGVALVGVFVGRSLRIERPLLDLSLMRERSFSAAAVTTFCLGGALFGGMIMLPLYFQVVRGESALATGLLLIPQGIGSAVSMWLSAPLTERLGAGVTALVGGVIGLVATLPLIAIGGHTSFVLIGGVMVVRGFGIGLSFMPAMTAAFRQLRPRQVNDASPQLNVLQRVGGSIGTAILTVVLQNHLLADRRAHLAPAGAFGTTFAWVSVITAVAILPTFVLIWVERRSPAPAAAGAGTGDGEMPPAVVEL